MVVPLTRALPGFYANETMSRLPFEAMLAFRYLRPRRTFVSIITIISVLGVLVGVAVLIVVIAVMSGFDQEWRNRILGFNAHIKVFQANGIMDDYEKVATQIRSNKIRRRCRAFVTSKIFVKTDPPPARRTSTSR